MVTCYYCSENFELSSIIYHIIDDHVLKNEKLVKKHRCPIVGCFRNDEEKYPCKMNAKDLLQHFNRNHWQQVRIRSNDNDSNNQQDEVKEKADLNLLTLSKPKFAYKNVGNDEQRTASVAKSIDEALFAFLSEHACSDKTYNAIVDLITNIANLASCNDLVYILQHIKFKSFIRYKKEFIIKDEIEDIVKTKKLIKRKRKLDKNPSNKNNIQETCTKIRYPVYTINLENDIKNYLNVYYDVLARDIQYLKTIIYIDDINTNNPISSHSKNGMLSHCAFKLLLTNDLENCSEEMAKIVHHRTFAICFTKDAKICNYTSFAKYCCSQFENKKIQIKNDRWIQLKVHAIIGDHLILQNVFMKPLNFRATGTNPCCRGCDIIPNDYKNHLLCSSSSSRLQGHSVDYLPIANNMYSDYFHDLNEGIQGYICYSSINYFLILTNENEEVFRINLLSIIENYDDISLKALLCPDFFKLTPVKRKILLKKKFNLSGHQTHIMLRAFYDYLKQKLLSDANISSISTLYSMLGMMNYLLSLSYLLEDVTKTASCIAKTISFLVDRFFTFLMLTFPNYKLSLKFHMLTHYQDWILRLGHPFWLNTKHFESSHQRIKKASCLSKNKISRMKTILSKLVLFETTSLNNRSNPKKEISLLRKNWEYIDMCPIFTNKTFSFTYNSLDDSISNSTLNGIGNFGENEIQSMQNVIKMELERIFSGSRKNDINFTEDDELSETEEI